MTLHSFFASFDIPLKNCILWKSNNPKRHFFEVRRSFMGRAGSSSGRSSGGHSSSAGRSSGGRSFNSGRSSSTSTSHRSSSTIRSPVSSNQTAPINTHLFNSTPTPRPSPPRVLMHRHLPHHLPLHEFLMANTAHHHLPRRHQLHPDGGGIHRDALLLVWLFSASCLLFL